MDRRRMMMGGGRDDVVPENGLLFWLDGLNDGKGGGYNAAATQWWPLKKAASLDSNFCLLTTGTVNRKANGFEIPYSDAIVAGGLYSLQNPQAALTGHNMTIIVVASGLNASSSWRNTPGVLTITQYRQEYSRRQGLTMYSGTDKLAIRGYSSEAWSFSSYTSPRKADVAAFAVTSNGTSGTLLTDFDGVVRKDTNMYAFRKDTSANMMIVGGYEYYPFINNNNMPSSIARSKNNWQDWPGTYHAVVMYDRVLTDDEIMEVIGILKKRYKLNK